ncbi:hypothetical protein HO133_002454 [Letharia lupina]|uniref:Uncharacterized protein n=1 Tax=Letharia lupina TaxID=560253 RepID=A0A8H6FAM5_9LECA|nr:uncharacterized protein HO133_002454 [Letharia lupina]KAF6220774.1 hypothetical protein HO133_002454 [Letharia lupina]
MPSTGFLRLLPELRNTVYQHIYIRARRYVSGRDWSSATYGNGLFFTCRQIYQETIHQYHSFDFVFLTGSTTDYSWLDKIGSEVRNKLLNAAVDTESFGVEPRMFFYMLSRCEQLSRKIGIRLSRLISMWQNGAFESMHGFHWARAIASPPVRVEVRVGSTWVNGILSFR